MKIQVLNNEGHQEFAPASAAEALQTIREHAGEDAWVFVDGQLVNRTSLTEADIAGAQEVTITPAVQGG